MPMECKHCNRPAEWRWSDADGNEYSDICQRCMETIAPYQYAPLWQFTPLPLSFPAQTQYDQWVANTQGPRMED